MPWKDPTKKCPYCSVTLGLDDTVCFSCKKKVGKSNEHGIAKKPFDWKGYLLSIISIVGLAYFIWFAFLKEQA